MTMKKRQQEAVILALSVALQREGSWCGETHLQKAAYLLKELATVPLDTHFILYKHGPFSFELRDELTAMRADGLLDWNFRLPMYGPSLTVTESGRQLMKRWPRTIQRFGAAIEFVSKELGTLGVADLERIATALYVTKARPHADVDSRAESTSALKPHVTVEAARIAVEHVDSLLKKCPTVAA
jgi:uncharacterized protein YwgA